MRLEPRVRMDTTLLMFDHAPKAACVRVLVVKKVKVSPVKMDNIRAAKIMNPLKRIRISSDKRRVQLRLRVSAMPAPRYLMPPFTLSILH